MSPIAVPLKEVGFAKQVEFRLLKIHVAASVAPASLARAVLSHIQQIANTDLNMAVHFAKLLLGEKA